MPSPTPQSLLIGQQAEAKVFAALAGLPAPWQFFQTVEWRTLADDGERVGEADAVVFTRSTVCLSSKSRPGRSRCATGFGISPRAGR
ncbi:MAG: hypothetical protein ACOYNF_18680 [Rhodoferax sp.]